MEELLVRLEAVVFLFPSKSVTVQHFHCAMTVYENGYFLVLLSVQVDVGEMHHHFIFIFIVIHVLSVTTSLWSSSLCCSPFCAPYVFSSVSKR